MDKPEFSPEMKLIIKKYVEEQKAKYGENWKEIKAKEMTAQTMKDIAPMLKLLGIK